MEVLASMALITTLANVHLAILVPIASTTSMNVIHNPV